VSDDREPWGRAEIDLSDTNFSDDDGRWYGWRLRLFGPIKMWDTRQGRPPGRLAFIRDEGPEEARPWLGTRIAWAYRPEWLPLMAELAINDDGTERLNLIGFQNVDHIPSPAHLAEVARGLELLGLLPEVLGGQPWAHDWTFDDFFRVYLKAWNAVKGPPEADDYLRDEGISRPTLHRGLTRRLGVSWEGFEAVAQPKAEQFLEDRKRETS
jgi:hypothetical protein